MSSPTPRSEQSGVAMVRMAYQFIHGGIIRLMHCGRMICHRVWLRVKDRDSAASHCAEGTEFSAPRTISEILAMTGSDRPNTALTQPGIGMVTPRIVISKGKASRTTKSSTSHGE